MKNAVSSILILVILLFIVSSEANACWCRKDPEETNTPKRLRKVIGETYNNSDIVFSATAVERSGEYLKFKVEKIWKGEKQTEILFTSVNYVDLNQLENRKNSREKFIDSCVSYYFKIGESYLIYAVKENGEFLVSKCGRTQILDDATKDVEELNLLVEEKNKSEK